MNKLSFRIILSIVVLALITSCKKYEIKFVCGSSTVKDIDGNVYNTVLIGSQCWINENLKTKHYRNGSSIDYPGNDNGAWERNTSGAYACYNNDIDWKDKYGALYNWYAVKNNNGLCPKGWSIPSNIDWAHLENYLDSQGFPVSSHYSRSGGNALKSCRQKNSPYGDHCNTSEHPRWASNAVHRGFDEFGFSRLPGGYRSTSGHFADMGLSAFWWNIDEYDSIRANFRLLFYRYGLFNNAIVYKGLGYSVRCIKD